jgi:hypothetical protein
LGVQAIGERLLTELLHAVSGHLLTELLHAVAAHLRTREALVLRKGLAILAQLMAFETPVLRDLRAIGAHLLAREAAILRLSHLVTAELLASEAVVLCLPLHSELMLRPLSREALAATMLARHCKALHPRRRESTAVPAAAERLELRPGKPTVIPATAAATKGLEVRIAAAVATTAATLEVRVAAAAMLLALRGTAAMAAIAVIASRPCRCRHRDRQGGDSGGEE